MEEGRREERIGTEGQGRRKGSWNRAADWLRPALPLSSIPVLPRSGPLEASCRGLGEH